MAGDFLSAKAIVLEDDVTLSGVGSSLCFGCCDGNEGGGDDDRKPSCCCCFKRPCDLPLSSKGDGAGRGILEVPPPPPRHGVLPPPLGDDYGGPS